MGKNAKKAPGVNPDPPPGAPPESLQTLDVVLRRPMKVGTVDREVGETIARVTLVPGCSLNFLGRAIVDSIASEKVEPETKS